MTQPGIEPRSSGPLANTLLIRPITQFNNGWVIPKTQKMVLDAALLNTQDYKVNIKGKVEQPREWSSALPYISV